MALNVLVLRKKLTDAKAKLDEAQSKIKELESREAELESDINEASTEEEMKVVEEAVEQHEAEKAEAEEKAKEFGEEVSKIENELDELEKNQEQVTVPPVEENGAHTEPVEEKKERKTNMSMKKRSVFAYLDFQTRQAMLEKAENKAWLDSIRTAIKEKRSVNNVGLTIPEDYLGVIKENIAGKSKLYKYVRVRPVSGNGRQAVQGTISEGVWIECCANLNELDLSYSDVETNCYMVGGFYKLCDADIEDSDEDLAETVLNAISAAIAIALDKAILYGKNTSDNNKMPLGVFSRLAQTSQPADYPSTARPWADLHTTHMLTIANTVTGIDLFKTLLVDSAIVSSKYATEGLVWCMNDTTKKYLQANAMSLNANGNLVSAIDDTMPFIGGVIETLDFMPNYVIGVGHFDLYLLAERGGEKFASSDQVYWLQNATVFKGTARYDGLPVIAEAFAGIGVNGTTPDASMNFAADTKNSVEYIILDKAAATVEATETVQLKAKLLPENVKGTITWATSDDTKATVDTHGVVTGVAAGSAVITATCNGAVAVCNVTVTAS